MLREPSEMEAVALDGIHDTRAESRKKGGREGGTLWVSDRNRSGTGGLCKGPGVSVYLVGFWSCKTGQLGRIQRPAPVVGNVQGRSVACLWLFVGSSPNSPNLIFSGSAVLLFSNPISSPTQSSFFLHRLSSLILLSLFEHLLAFYILLCSQKS